MELYVGIIPDHIDDFDLRKFFNITGNMASFRIVTHDVGEGVKARYGLVNVDSEKLGFQLIAKFNGKFIKDTKVVVREFIRRNYSNDRRALNWRQKDWHDVERRQDDRRGSLMREAMQTLSTVAATA